jgi:hypothetical protein
MSRGLLLVIAAGLGLAACSDVSGPHAAAPAPERGEPALLSTPSGDSGPERIPGQYIVAFKQDVRDVPGLARRLAAAHGGATQFIYEHALKGFAVRIPDAAAAALARNPNVAFVEQDQVIRIVATQSPTPSWGLDRIDEQAQTSGSDYTYNYTGAGVKAYIIDTGIRTDHSDFGGRASTGFDAIGDGQNGNDCNGHGTHVAGTVGGVSHGVAKEVQLVAVRVLNCSGSGTTSGVIAGVDWVTANHVKPVVANMSLGGGASTALDNAVQNSINAGVTYAIAAGNSNRNACNYSPARVGAAVTVGATTSSDSRASYSNYGTCLDLFAPGSSITSAWYTSATATNTISGTSMAAPHVAGVAALYLQGNTTATPVIVRDAIVNNATSNAVTSPGTGSPNKLLYSLLTEPAPSPPPPPPPPPDGAPCTDCTAYTGSLSGAGDYDIHPDGRYYYSGSGTHSGWLRGPAGTDFDLYLEKWNGWWWGVVARAESTSSEESITYSGSSGYYRWAVQSYSGSGSYTFWLQKP